MLTNRIRYFYAIVLMVFLLGCAGQYDGLKSFSEMSPKEKATWFMSVYNAQARDFKDQVMRTDLTEKEKDILRIKRQVLKEVYPMIKIYNQYIDGGMVPSVDIESEIVKLINRLQRLITTD